MATEWMIYMANICFIISTSISCISLGNTDHKDIFERPLSAIASIALTFLGVGLFLIYLLLGC